MEKGKEMGWGWGGKDIGVRMRIGMGMGWGGMRWVRKGIGKGMG